MIKKTALKKTALIFLLIFAPHFAGANVFDDALKFVCGNSNVTETWNGASNSYAEYKLCPPYNKYGNRGGCLKQYSPPTLGTLFYFKYCAEEAPSSSYFSPKIQVRMQSCNSLLFTCWAFSTELSWDGECILWPTPWLYPLQRLCARMAVPADNSATPATPADDGYTYFKHLNFEGATVTDKRIPGTDGQSTFIISPKICAYWDPWAFDLFPIMPLQYIPLFDLFDYNPIKQPFHRGSGVHPIVQMMISFIEAGLNSSQMIVQLLIKIEEASMGPIGLLVDFIGNKSGLTKIIIDLVTSIIKLVGEEVFIRILKEFGQLNHVVYESLGCVNVPMGPFPPPYPPQYQVAPPAPIIESVCATTADYTVTVTSTQPNFTAPAPYVTSAPPLVPANATSSTPLTTSGGITTTSYTTTDTNGYRTTTTSTSPSFIASNSSKGCATSLLTNNAINNVVRVGFDHILQRCDLAAVSGSQAAGSSQSSSSSSNTPSNACVTFASPPLASATSGAAGIPAGSITTQNVPPPSTCGTSSSNCGYRVIYATQYAAGSQPLPNPYYDPTIVNCNGVTYPCQLVWGINSGPYADIALRFPAQETQDSGNTLVNNDPGSIPVTLTYNAQGYKFLAAISRNSTSPANLDNAANAYSSISASDVGVSSQDPSKICVYMPTDPSILLSQGGGTSSNWTLSTCLPRATTPAPTVSACGTAGTPSCTSTHFAPQMVVALKVGSDVTQGVLAAAAFSATQASGSDPSNPTYNPTTSLNLAGYEFTATVTDDTFITPPFPNIANTIRTSTAQACGNQNFATYFSAHDYQSFSYTPNANNGTLFGNHNPAANTAACPQATFPFYISNTSNPISQTQDQVVQTGAIYLKGLEYINNKYLVGGTYMCLTTSNNNTCASNVSNCVLTTLLNSDIIDCSSFNTNVKTKYPNISFCSTSDSTCSSIDTIQGSGSNLISIYQCGSANDNTLYKCYSYNGSASKTNKELCTPSLDPNDRITPDRPNPVGSNPKLTANQYYDASINNNTIQNAVQTGSTNSTSVVQSCSAYLNKVTDLTNPSINPYISIPQCATINSTTARNAVPLCTGSSLPSNSQPNPFPGYMCYNSTANAPVCSTAVPIIETFTSTLSTNPTATQQLNIRNCVTTIINPITGAQTSQNNYCYDPVPAPTATTTCQINSAAVTRNTAGGNPAVGSSTLACSTFISLFGNSNSNSLVSSSPYSGITACSASPSGSVIATLTSSSSPALTVDIYQSAAITQATATSPMLPVPVKQLNYCYNPRSSGTCTLNRTNTAPSRPSQMDCYSLLTLINSNYKDIMPCSTPPEACASKTVLDAYAAQNYASTTTCTSTINTPQCTLEATVVSASSGNTVTVNKCSYNTTLSLNYQDGTTSAMQPVAQNYYCYNVSGSSSSSCTLNTSDVTITPGNPVPASLSTSLPALSIPSVITDINGTASVAPSNTSSTGTTTGVRSKTALEQGLCVDVPALPNCTAITNASSSTNYATWDPAAPGTQVRGQCMNGYTPISSTSLLRYCLISPENAQPGNSPSPYFEPLTAAMGCKPSVCSAVNTLSASDGYALWRGSNPDGSTTLDQQATGTCASGFTSPNLGALAPRTCMLNSSSVAVLSPVDSTNTCTILPWNVQFIYPDSAHGVWTAASSASPTFYAYDFVSGSQTVGNFFSNTNAGWSNGAPYSYSNINKTAIFVPGPKTPSNVSANNVITLYLNIPNITQIAKIAYIDNQCSWNGKNNCLTTSPTWSDTKSYLNLSTSSASTNNPLVIYGKSGVYNDGSGSAQVQFGQAVNLKVNGISNWGNYWGPYKWFGWSSEGYGGHDGWLIYTTTDVDTDNGVYANAGANPPHAAPSPLHSGLNTIQISFKQDFTSIYTSGLGFWYIELKSPTNP